MTVDEALALYPAEPDGEYGGRDWVESSDAATMLAAEVRRLREAVTCLSCAVHNTGTQASYDAAKLHNNPRWTEKPKEKP